MTSSTSKLLTAKKNFFCLLSYCALELHTCHWLLVKHFLFRCHHDSSFYANFKSVSKKIAHYICHPEKFSKEWQYVLSSKCPLWNFTQDSVFKLVNHGGSLRDIMNFLRRVHPFFTTCSVQFSFSTRSVT